MSLLARSTRPVLRAARLARPSVAAFTQRRWIQSDRRPDGRDPYSVPLTEQAGEVFHDAAAALSGVAKKAKRVAAAALERADDALPDAEARSDRAREDLRDDAARLKQQATNNLGKLKNNAMNVGLDLKESAESVFHKAKKSVRAVKESLTEAVSTTNESSTANTASVPPEATVQSSLFQGPQEMPQGVGDRAHDSEGRPMETGTRGS